MHMKHLLHLTFCFLGLLATSQNLVLNPSFEEFKDCPWNIGMFNNNVSYWSCPNHGSTDFFRTCNSANTTNENYNGRQHPAEGKGYAGLYCYAIDDYREYIQGELSQTLEADKLYEVSFHVSLSEASSHALKTLSVLFTGERIGYQLNRSSVFQTPNSDYSRFSNLSEKYIDLTTLKVELQSLYQINTSGFYTDMVNWETITFVYKAKGYEQFLTIGNFSSNKDTVIHQVNADFEHPFAYYYIDEVSVVEIENYEVEKTYTFKNVLFDFDKATLLDISQIELDSLYQHLESHSKLYVEIYGHTDAVGTQERNEELSQERAKAVQDYLILKGLNPTRIKAFGFGSSLPVDSNETEVGRSQNRRVEFKLIQEP